MLKWKLIVIFFAFKNLLIPSIHEKKLSGFHVEKRGYGIKKTGKLSDSIPENSGLEISAQGNTFLTHGDGGCKNSLYEIDINGNILSEIKFPGLANYDWEDITKDSSGNVYIGDFGNNYNTRKNLRIYKVNMGEDNRVDTISFQYPDQKTFPPSEKEMNFDCESMFWYNDSLYLFSKNRGEDCVKFYKIPDKPGNYKAKLFNEMFLNSPVTAADISPDKKWVALLTYGKIYFLKAELGNRLTLSPGFTKIFNRSKQAEALVFINNTDLLVSNEQGELFLVKKKE